MKKTVQAIMVAAVVATALAANAETVVHYTFDDLGDVGTVLADSSTIQNKANPGTLDATVYGIKNGYIKDANSVHHPYVTNGVPEFTRIWDPISGAKASDSDRALRFPATNAAGQGALLEVDADASLRPESFTVEVLFRYPGNSISLGSTGWNRMIVMPNDAGYAWEIVVRWHEQVGFHFMKNDGSVTNRDWIAILPSDSNWYDGKWHHVALSVEQGETTSTVKMYLDYALKMTRTLNYRISYSSSNLPLQIGGRSGNQHCLGNFCGELGEFRFSNTALLPGQFLRPRSTAAQTSFDPDCVLYYDFEDFSEDWSWFAAGLGDVVNKANPGVMDGTFVTRNNLAPEIVEDSPAERFRQSMSDSTYEDSKKALQNDIAPGGSRNTGYITCTPVDEDWLSKTNFTIETFFKTDNQNQPYTALFQRWGGFNVQLKFGINSGGSMLGINISTNTAEQVQRDWYSFAAGEWHHAALVVNQIGENKEISLYIDGVRKNSMALDANLTALFKEGTTYDGKWYFLGSSGNSFDGAVDSLRVTLRALRPEEFLTSQRYPKGTTIAHLKFDDGTANAADDGGALFEGTISDSTFSQSLPGVKILDGEGGAVLSKPNVASLSVPNTSASVTWSGWQDLYYLRKDTYGNERSSGTVELWVKGNTKKTFAAILDAKITANGAYNDNLHAWRLGYDANDGGKPSVLFRYLKADGTRDNQRLTFDKVVTDGKWHHWAFTFQPNAADPTKSDIAFYLDYVQLGTVQTLPGRVAYDDTLRFAIGEGGSSFTGLIDEVRISDCVLAPSEFLRAEKPGFMMILR